MKNDLKIADSAFVAKGAILLGDVTLEENSSVWYNAVLRADQGSIYVGKNTNVQDNSCIHMDAGGSVFLGDNVTIGHSAVIHGCTVKNNTLIGMGAVVLERAVIGENCIVGANALVTGGTVIPDGSLVLGSPAKVVKQLTEAQIESIRENYIEYVNLAKEHKEMQENE